MRFIRKLFQDHQALCGKRIFDMILLTFFFNDFSNKPLYSGGSIKSNTDQKKEKRCHSRITVNANQNVKQRHDTVANSIGSVNIHTTTSQRTIRERERERQKQRGQPIGRDEIRVCVWPEYSLSVNCTCVFVSVCCRLHWNKLA